MLRCVHCDKGTGTSGLPSEDGLRATSSPLQSAVSVWGDTTGVLYVSQQYALRMVDIASTVLVTAAGTRHDKHRLSYEHEF